MKIGHIDPQNLQQHAAEAYEHRRDLFGRVEPAGGNPTRIISRPVKVAAVPGVEAEYCSALHATPHVDDSYKGTYFLTITLATADHWLGDVKHARNFPVRPGDVHIVDPVVMHWLTHMDLHQALGASRTELLDLCWYGLQLFVPSYELKEVVGRISPELGLKLQLPEHTLYPELK